MKAFRVITVSKDRANFNVEAGESMKDIFSFHLGLDEVVDVKDLTQDLKIDLYELQLAMQHYKIDEKVQLLVLSILKNYDNTTY